VGTRRKALQAVVDANECVAGRNGDKMGETEYLEIAEATAYAGRQAGMSDKERWTKLLAEASVAAEIAQAKELRRIANTLDTLVQLIGWTDFK